TCALPIWNSVVQVRNRLQVGLQLLVTSLLEMLAVWLLRICVYIVFIIQIIFSTVLIILGPFSVAASILPAFRDSFSTWIARFISVNLYSGIAYLVLYVSSLFQQYAMEAEITRYQELVGTAGPDSEKLSWFAGNGILSFGMVIGTFIIGALTMLTVPSISTWTISTSATSSAAHPMGRGASGMSRVLGRGVTMRRKKYRTHPHINNIETQVTLPPFLSVGNLFAAVLLVLGVSFF